MLPFLSALTAVPSSWPLPPALLAQSSFPEGSYFTKKTSSYPEFIQVYGPKLIEGQEYNPVAKIFPAVSVHTALPMASLIPPALFTQSKFPFASYFAINIFMFPLFTSVVEPNTIDGLQNQPVTITLPFASAQTDRPSSLFAPPALFTHKAFPLLSNFAM